MNCTNEDCEEELLPDIIGDNVIGWYCPKCNIEYTKKGTRIDINED